MYEERSGNGVAWTGLVVAVVSLILSWSAYNNAQLALDGGTSETTSGTYYSDCSGYDGQPANQVPRRCL